MTYPDPTKQPAQQEAVVLGALTVLGEARGESDIGKAAIAHVLMNRMAKKNATMADTALAKWQFSCWNATDKNRQFLMDTIAREAKNVPLGLWVACLTAMNDAMTGKSGDVTANATHYCTLTQDGKPLWNCDDSQRSKPRWHSKQCIDKGITKETARIGQHVFAVTPW